MRVTVLGASAVRPNPGGACSGYLVEAGRGRFLVDCGPGVVAQLRRWLDPEELDAVVISHGHPDHLLDLVTLRGALRHGPGPHRERPLPVHVAPTVVPLLDALGDVLNDDGVAYWSDQLEIRAYAPDAVLDLGPLEVTFSATRHYVQCWAMRFEAEGAALVYTADTGPVEGLAAFAAGAELLLAEATLPERAGHEEAWGHLTPAEAGQLAAEAGARRLLLTHYMTEFEPNRLRAAAAKTFAGPVEMAVEGSRHEV